MSDEARVWISRRKCRKRTTYHLRWIDPVAGKMTSKRAGTDRKHAEREAAKMEEKLEQGTYQHLKRSTWPEFVQDHVSKIAGAANAVAAKHALDEFGRSCSPVSPRAITYGMVEAFVVHLRKKNNRTATINKKLRYLRAAFNKAIKRGYISRSPMDGWEWAREDDPIPRALADEEKSKLLDACPTDQWRTFVHLALTTGCRRGELLGLTWDRVDFANARLIITGTKAQRNRVQPLNSEAVAMLRDLQRSTLRDGGPFVSLGPDGTTVSHRFKQIVETAGIAGCTIHDLRRTFCTDLARLGVNQLVVQRLAGHASASTTARYYQLVDDPMKREAVSRLSRSAS
ncbi:MAG: tyrosine-type recombinase/integrase [Phycisphaerales bacterium]|nr:MAG: tyrosine-type recombinase/integrase [Phycisphaerales bacterium]